MKVSIIIIILVIWLCIDLGPELRIQMGTRGKLRMLKRERETKAFSESRTLDGSLKT